MDTKRMTERLLKPAEVADRLGVEVRQVYRLITSGKLAATRLGYKTIRVKPADVDNLIIKGQSNAVS